MEYVPDGSLENWISQREIKDWKTLLALAIHIADGLAHAHNHGLIHRDLKPANILIKKYPIAGKGFLPAAKITDFGLVKKLHDMEIKNNPPQQTFLPRTNLIETKLTADGGFVGTKLYASPEQLNGESDLDRNTDVYSFGIILCEMVTHRNIQMDLIKYWSEQKNGLWDVSSQFNEYVRKLIYSLCPNCPDRLISLIIKCIQFCRTNRWRDEKIAQTFAYFNSISNELKSIFHEAIGKAYSQVFEIHDIPKYLELNYKGVSYLNLKMYDKAIIQLKNSIQERDDWGISHANLSMAHFYNGDIKNALDEINISIDLNPTDAVSFNNKALILNGIGKNTTAIELFDKAIELSPNDEFLYYNRGLILGKGGNYEKARKDFEKTIEIDNQNANAYNGIGMCIMNSNSTEDPIPYFDLAIKSNPICVEAYSNKILVFYRSNRYQDALLCCKEALIRSPSDERLLRWKQRIEKALN